jgi:hypothetical protein
MTEPRRLQMQMHFAPPGCHDRTTRGHTPVVDELGEGERPGEPLLAPPFLERPLQRGPRVLLTRKTTMLHDRGWTGGSSSTTLSNTSTTTGDSTTMRYARS